METLLILKAFKDKETGAVYKAGEEVEFSDERAAVLIRDGRRLVDRISEKAEAKAEAKEEEKAVEEIADPKPKKKTAAKKKKVSE